jgi:hypothetical protein
MAPNAEGELTKVLNAERELIKVQQRTKRTGREQRDKINTDVLRNGSSAAALQQDAVNTLAVLNARCT